MTVTLITGANKGIGFATAGRLVALGHTVFLAGRHVDRARSAADALGCRWVQLDVTDQNSVSAAFALVEATIGHLDVLINNAGVWDAVYGIDGIRAATSAEIIDTNVTGIVRTTQAALPLLARSDNPVIVNVGSVLGSFEAATNPAYPQSGINIVVYSATKAAVSMLTLQYARALPGMRINVAEPGLTSTDLNGNGAGQTPEQAADTVVRLACLDPDGPTGTFQGKDGIVPW